ncbi:protein phosphatase 1 regulatory subunit 1A-like isoform X2 [Colossoma macropomum]|uniref:protein phosphatase 1 regulatory subunit 1A-like isoform X2 n=1 Tax=Colossoma macropomum TaxID=42526 RepID=UPI0018648AFC|nr:protein phosphatase 1 regulatory subunit 1A-like isoform X2 [Colossoma macropomum]
MFSYRSSSSSPSPPPHRHFTVLSSSSLSFCLPLSPSLFSFSVLVSRPFSINTMDTGSPRKIQFTVPLLDSHLDPEAAEQIRRRRPTPATLVASSDQSSPEIDEDRLSNHLYKQALLNSPRQRRKGAKGTPTMKELQFLVEHHLHRQQQGAADESSESCLSERTSPDAEPGGEELPEDEGSWSTTEKETAEALEKLRCQMEELSRESLSEAAGGTQTPLSREEAGAAVATATSKQQTQSAAAAAAACQSSSTGSPAASDPSQKIRSERK